MVNHKQGRHKRLIANLPRCELVLLRIRSDAVHYPFCSSLCNVEYGTGRGNRRTKIWLG
jgi:hypothetical protein